MPSRELLRRVRRIEIQTRRLVHERFAGGYHSVFKGRGIEFAQIREYTPGDDVRLIDWNATARLNQPFVKLFVEERELTVMLLVDVSASMYFGSQERLKRQLATEFCATIAFSAISNNDRVGMVLFSDRIERLVPPKKGRRHILRLISELLQFTPQHRQTDLAGALDTAARLVRHSGTLFVVSDFESGEYRRALAMAGKRHDTIAVSIRDRYEAGDEEPLLPDEGIYALEDPETGEVRLVDFGHQPTRAAWLANRRAAAR
ncbi:MAG: DUF58 domain-containing protein, partial [Armatimonadetes bacterium]|nr:DUF58 domain-containing protein [Armatimonadota bacterium]